MNLVGKICIILILIVSLGFMFLSMAVYATHQNWRVRAEAVKKQLGERNSENERLVERRNRTVQQIEIERDIAVQELVKVERERNTLAEYNSKMQQALDNARLLKGQAIEAAKAVQDNNTQITKELEVLRTEMRNEQADRDTAFAEAKKATDALHQKFNQLVKAKERVQELIEDNAKYRHWIASLGHDPSRQPDAVVPRVEGEILLVRRHNTDQLIEISIGSDDGLTQGHTVEVYRGQRYLGRAHIQTTAPDKSVGKMIPRTTNGRIEVGDRVATKLRVG